MVADDKKTTELVDGSNCDTDGDGICDTPADPGLTNAIRKWVLYLHWKRN